MCPTALWPIECECALLPCAPTYVNVAVLGGGTLQESSPSVGFLASALLPCALSYVNVVVSGGSDTPARKPALAGFLAPLHHITSVIPMHAFSTEYSSAKYGKWCHGELALSLKNHSFVLFCNHHCGMAHNGTVWCW